MSSEDQDAKVVRAAVEFATLCKGYFTGAKEALERIISRDKDKE